MLKRLMQGRGNLKFVFWYLMVLGNGFMIASNGLLQTFVESSNHLGNASGGLLILGVSYALTTLYALFASIATWKSASCYFGLELWQDLAKLYVVFFAIGYLLLAYYVYDADMVYLKQLIFDN